MTSLKFEGDVAGLEDVQLNLFREAFKKHGYEVGTVTIEPVGKIGENYMANIKRLSIHGENGPFKMVAKVAPKQEMLRAMANTDIAFRNETFMYMQVIPKLRNLQKSVGTPEEELLRYPACYGTLNEAPNEVILLEDLKELGFGIRSRFDSLQDTEVRLMLKNLATFHALGFVLKEKEPIFHEDAKKQLINLWEYISKVEEFQKGLVAAEACAIKLLDNELHKELAKGKILNVWSFVNDFAEREKNSPHVCIIQGDCWVNNIMFKVVNDKTECIMIDYQVSRVTNPIVDVIYFIFNCTDKEARKDNYFEWIDYYYSVFRHVLSKFDMNASEVYSRVELHKDLKVYGSYMYGLCIFFINILTRDSEEIFDVKALSDEEFKDKIKNMDEYYDIEKLRDSSQQRYKTRLQGLTESFIEYGYI